MIKQSQEQEAGRFSSYLHLLFAAETLVQVAMAVMHHHGLLTKFDIDETTFKSWVRLVGNAYLTNPYHNAVHATVCLLLR